MTAFPTMTSETLRPATRPTLYFIGVSTGSSSIQKVFPRWAEALGLEGAVLQGIDLPIHADADVYRRTVDFIANDPLSRGALVTTHKIDLYQAASDLFDVRDEFSTMMGETSCISKSEAGLVCHAKDPISSGLALDAFVPDGHWSRTGGDVCLLGAGGSSIAISWYLSQLTRADRPGRIVVTNRSSARLDHIREFHEGLDTDTRFEYVLAPEPEVNDAVVAALPAGSLVVNATGLGKDAPGSPLTDRAEFPEESLAWELNYRGDLVFLEQARRQHPHRVRHAEDGWIYFLHGWTQVIGEVFAIEIPTRGPVFDSLSEQARGAR
ncbi:shikimate dehydrogenase family protein [Microbacterium sp. E-13]|uniref:shikimate dehydrogenase family protein n=1 Tax=Microbacterium sp. E-13 TaxID=3404048 RepID=UPI003CEA6C81